MRRGISPIAQPGEGLPLGLLAAAGFVSVAGVRMIDPLLSSIARDFSTTAPAISIIIAAFTVSYGVNQLVLGPVGDRFGKMRVMMGALIAYTVSTTACAAASGLPSLALWRACAGAASAGLIPVCLAYIGDFVPYEFRQVTLSRFSAGIVTAQIVAGPLGGAIGEIVGWRGVFLLMGIIGLALTVALGLRIRTLPDRIRAGAPPSNTYRVLLCRPDARMILSATAAEGALTGGIFPFLPQYLHAHFMLPYAVIGLVLACFGVGMFLHIRFARLAVSWADDSSKALAGGLLIAGAVVASVITIHITWFATAQVLMGFGYSMMHTVLQSRATELVPDGRSTAVSVFAFMLFLGQAMGTLSFGVGVAFIDYRLTFSLGALGMVALAGWLLCMLRRHPVAAPLAAR